MRRLTAWAVLLLGSAYFLLPLVGMTEFSLKMRRGVYSFDAYARVFEDPRFWETFGYSLTLAAATIVFGIFLVVPTAYWVRLKLPQARPVIEFMRKSMVAAGTISPEDPDLIHVTDSPEEAIRIIRAASPEWAAPKPSTILGESAPRRQATPAPAPGA